MATAVQTDDPKEAAFLANLHYRLAILGVASVNALAPLLKVTKQALYKRLQKGAEGAAWWEQTLAVPEGSLLSTTPGPELSTPPDQWPL